MKPKTLTLALGLMLFLAMAVNAQDNNDTASIEGVENSSSTSRIEYNPSGVNMKIEGDKLLLYFKNRMSNLRCEVINKKGELLFVTRAKSTQYSTIDVSDLKSGTYFVRVKFYDGTLKEFFKFSKK